MLIEQHNAAKKYLKTFKIDFKLTSKNIPLLKNKRIDFDSLTVFSVFTKVRIMHFGKRHLAKN